MRSLKIVDASDLDSLLMYFSFIISCLCLNRYFSFDRFFPFVLLHDGCLHIFLCVWLLYFSIYLLIYFVNLWAVGILNFLISPVIYMVQQIIFILNLLSCIFAISLLWSFLFSNVHKYINWRFSYSKFSGNIPASFHVAYGAYSLPMLTNGVDVYWWFKYSS